MTVFVAKEPHETSPQILWVATLSNGEIIYEDDRKDLIEPPWSRLRQYILEENVSIVKLILHRGADVITVPDNQRGYIAGKRIQTLAPPASITFHTKCVGWLDENDVCHLTWARIPEFMQRETETRTPEKAGFFLIRNNAQE